MKKRLFAVLCSCVLTVSFIPNSFADDTNNNDFKFTPITDEQKAKRPAQSGAEHIMNAHDVKGSVVYLDKITDPNLTIESFETGEEISLIEYFRRGNGKLQGGN